MSLRVHISEDYEESVLDDLRARLAREVALSTGDIAPETNDYQVLVAGVPSREHLATAANLHTLIIPWSGVPKRTLALLQEFPNVAVYNLHHNAAPVAEMAMTLMLAATRWLIPVDRSMRRNDWRAREAKDICLLLEDRTCLILGYGAIGRRIARMCHGFGMKVLAVKRDAAPSQDEIAEIFPVKDLKALLPRADVVFVCVPLTPDTRGMLGADELEALPVGATVVNIARGSIIDEGALFQALVQNRIRAGLDVWYNYPDDESELVGTSPSAYPFHHLDNVVMTPHIGFKSDRTDELRVKELAVMLNELATGKSLPNRVDISREY
jgi:phosphoglycerate dehydrogenase-like enzyme